MPDPIVNSQASLALTQYIEIFGIYPPRDTVGGVGTHISVIHTSASPVFMGNSNSAVAYANGALIPIAQNTALFSLLGTTYGGNGQTNFALPNLVGRASIYDGQGPSLTSYTLGEVFGQDVASVINAQLPSSLGGAAAAIDNHQPTLALTYFINAYGIFPSRGDGATGTNLIGQIYQAAENFPVGIPCDGRLLAIANYDVLFALIGTTYGGDGQTTFAIPDLRGRNIIGTGNGHVVGDVLGVENITIGQANLPINMGGNGTPINNQQPGLVLNTMVALNGIFQGFDDLTPAIGEIIYFAGPFIPTGYAAAQGQLLPINSNQALFSLLGTTYGGNGTTNFALPNLAGRAIVGTDNQAGHLAAGTVLGTDTVQITSAMISSLTLNGTVNADTLYGGDSVDVLNGFASNDRLTGNGGSDQLNGGDGIDTANYEFNTGAVYAELNINKVFESTLTVGTVLGGSPFASQDVLALIENVTGSAFGDRIYGTAGDNILAPRGGNDIVYAGAGIDTLDYGVSTGSVYVDLSAGTALESNLQIGTVGAATAFISNDYVLEFENIDGSAFGDRLYGTATANVINGNDGDDFLYGGAGADILNGGNGVDRIVGEGGADVMTGGGGNDRFIFSTAPEAGIDTITDFVVGSDQLFVMRSAFGLGAGDPVNLVINGAATAAAPTFLYDSTTGILSFDADGTGAIAAAEFANIGANIGLSPIDIVLYG
jgi:microcystin-dependent protein